MNDPQRIAEYGERSQAAMRQACIAMLTLRLEQATEQGKQTDNPATQAAYAFTARALRFLIQDVRALPFQEVR